MMKLGTWARPTLIGPFLTCWGLVTFASLGGQLRTLFDIDSWALAMLLVSFFAAGVAVCLVAIDVTFLKWKWRRLPSGGLGWFSSMMAPVFVWISWLLLPGGDTVPRTVATLIGGVWCGALAARVVFGRKP